MLQLAPPSAECTLLGVLMSTYDVYKLAVPSDNGKL